MSGAGEITATGQSITALRSSSGPTLSAVSSSITASAPNGWREKDEANDAVKFDAFANVTTTRPCDGTTVCGSKPSPVRNAGLTTSVAMTQLAQDKASPIATSIAVRLIHL